jgi:hyperosmotically inducible protein
MVRHMFVAIVITALTLTTCAPVIQAQNAAPTWSQDDTVRIVKEVQKKLGSLTTYSVFDWITFGIHGKTLVLKGYASRPVLKSDAENAVKNIPGIEHVDNQIEVLPPSPNDDRIRAEVYNRIYTSPALSIYNANAGRLRGGLGAARLAGGITNDPPLGFHAIHIIVKNGNVMLFGVVNSETDVAIAGMQANSAPGVFSVENYLIAQNSKPKTKAQ